MSAIALGQNGACRVPGIGILLDFDLVAVDVRQAVFSDVPGDHVYNSIDMIDGSHAGTLQDSAYDCAVHSASAATSINARYRE